MARKLSASSNLKILLENCQKNNHRCLLPIIHMTKEHIMIIHHMISKLSSEQYPILWCHANNANIPCQQQSRLKKLKKDVNSGKVCISSENAFDLFLLSANIKFCSYDDSPSILGNTYGMCILQDFEKLTPNLICRTVETVRGGGVIILCFNNDVTSLRDLFHIPMAVHKRLKTFTHPEIFPLFNERLIISLGWCKTCLVLNKNLEVRHEVLGTKNNPQPVQDIISNEDEQLTELLSRLADAEKPLPQLVGLCKTVDQAKAVLKMIDVITDKDGKSTVAISASRGRGKSAAMGIAVAAAIHFGFGNIFVVSPSPENLVSFFDLVLKGFDALEYEENTHYELLQSVSPEFRDAVIRINVFSKHRQIIQYVHPRDYKKVSQAELVVIDEAAAIPLPVVKELLGTHNVFMASTINGYEGTGRSLSLKLLAQLRQQSMPSGAIASSSSGEDTVHANCRPLHEITLERSIRYGSSDPVESWLNHLLCLDATSSVPSVSSCPPPSECELYYVNKKVLMSGHKDTENFLYHTISLLVSSHYKNSPDDLQTLSDAPAHHLFVLLAPLPKGGQTAVPTVFCVLQVGFEGGMSKEFTTKFQRNANRPAGNIIPWIMSDQFMSAKFNKLTSVRIIRAATHPEYQSMGYGGRAVELLIDYFKKKFIPLDEPTFKEFETEAVPDDSDLIGPRKHDAPLLVKLSERPPENLDYIGVSYGLTAPLFKFWRKANFLPIYISSIVNKVTGEFNCIMVNPLSETEESEDTPADLPKWLQTASQEFLNRFLSNLGSILNSLKSQLALSVLQSHFDFISQPKVNWNDVEFFVNGHDLQRMEAYSKNLSDRHLITDLLPALANFYFKKNIPSAHLSNIQAALLVGMGLQYQTIETVAKELSLPIASALGQFNRAIRRLLASLNELQQKEVSKHLPSRPQNLDSFTPVTLSLDQDLDAAAQEFEESQLRKTLLGDVRQFAIAGEEPSWQDAIKNGETANIISVKSNKRPARMTEKELEKELEEPKPKKNNKSKKIKRKH